MAKILILTPESCRDKSIGDLVNYYLKLIAPYQKTELKHYGSVSPQKGNSQEIEIALEKEKEKIHSNLNPRDMAVLMSEKGPTFTTQELHKKIEQWVMSAQGKLVFIFGGAHGLHNSLYTPEKQVLSLSPMTTTHELALVVWLEQLYRLATIKAGKRYHY